MWYKNIAGRFFELFTKHTCDRQTDEQTDGRTDGQNYDSQDHASIAASRGKNMQMSKQTFITIRGTFITFYCESTAKFMVCFRVRTRYS